MNSAQQFWQRWLIALLVSGLAACSQENDQETDLLQAEAYLSVAELYRDQGQFRASVIEAQNALQLVPGYLRTQIFVARLYLELGDNQEAVRVLQNLSEQVATDAEVQLLYAEALLNVRNNNAARAVLDDLQPQEQEFQIQRNWLLGNIYANEGNFVTSEEMFLNALAIDEENVSVLVSLSKLAFQQGEIELSNQYMQRAIASDPEDLDLWIWRGQFALLQADYETSEDAFFEALSIMGDYDTMTPKRFTVLQSIQVPLQMQQKNDEAIRYAQLIADTPQGQFQSSFNSAFTLFQSGDYSAAEEALAQVLAASPNSPDGNALLGMTQFAQGNFEAAQAALARLENISGTSPQVIKTLAATHLRLNQVDRAVSVLTDARANYPDDGSLVAMLATSEQARGNYDGAIDLYYEAIELQPDTAEIHFALAGSYFSKQDLDNTEAQLLRALEINPQFTNAKAAVVDLLLGQDKFDDARSATQNWLNVDSQSIVNNNLAGRVALVQGNVAEARQLFESSLRIEPGDLQSRLYMARVNLNQENYNAALADFQAVLVAEPANAEAITGILTVGRLSNSQADREAEIRQLIDSNTNDYIPALIMSQYYLGDNDLQRARDFAQLGYDREQNSSSRTTLLDIMLRQIAAARQTGNLSVAQDLLDQAMAISDQNVQLLTVAAGLSSQMEDYEQATQYVEQIKELTTGSAYGFEIEGDLWEVQQNFENALIAYQRGWDIGVSSNLGVKLHRTLTSLQRQALATMVLNEWLEESPDDTNANLLMAMDLQQNGQDEAAIEYYENVIDLIPDNLLLLNNLAWLYQDRQPDRALELSRKAAELYPDNADVLDTYGWILLKQNQRTQAVEVLQRALELSPDSEAIAEHLAEATGQQ